MGIRVAWWLRDRDVLSASPLDAYAAEATSWLPAADHSIDAVADAYAEFALLLVKASPDG